MLTKPLLVGPDKPFWRQLPWGEGDNVIPQLCIKNMKTRIASNFGMYTKFNGSMECIEKSRKMRYVFFLTGLTLDRKQA